MPIFTKTFQDITFHSMTFFSISKPSNCSMANEKRLNCNRNTDTHISTTHVYTTCTNVSNSYTLGLYLKLKRFIPKNSARYSYYCLSCETLEFQAISLKSLNQHFYFCALRDFIFLVE